MTDEIAGWIDDEGRMYDASIAHHIDRKLRPMYFRPADEAMHMTEREAKKQQYVGEMIVEDGAFRVWNMEAIGNLLPGTYNMFVIRKQT